MVRIGTKFCLVFLISLAGLYAQSTVPPTITSLSPSTVLIGSTNITLVIRGAGFTSNSSVRLKGEAMPTTFVDSTRLEVRVPDSLMTSSGSIAVVVANSTTTASNQVLMLVATGQPPILQRLDPLSVNRGTTANVSVIGENLIGGSISVEGAGMTIQPVSSSPSSITVTATVSADAPLGTRLITVTTAFGTSSFCRESNGPCVLTVSPAIDRGTRTDIGLLPYGVDSTSSSFTGYSVTRLTSGKILVAGGNAGRNAALFDPTTNTWTRTGQLNIARLNHAASLLPDGRVLVAGGSNFGAYVSSAEVYDPATGAWPPIGSMTYAGRAEAVLMPNGNVLLLDTTRTPTEDEERPVQIYDRFRNTFTRSAVRVDRWDDSNRRSPVVLPNGQVAFGFQRTRVAAYDPVTDSLGLISGGGSWSEWNSENPFAVGRAAFRQ